MLEDYMGSVRDFIDIIKDVLGEEEMAGGREMRERERGRERERESYAVIWCIAICVYTVDSWLFFLFYVREESWPRVTKQ